MGYTGKGKALAPREGGGRDLGIRERKWGEFHVQKAVIATGCEIDIETGGELKFNGAAIAAGQMNAAIALVGAMVGGAASAAHGGDATTTVLAANALTEGNRAVTIIVKGVVDLASGDGNLPIFQIGETDTLTKFVTIGHGGDPATYDAGTVGMWAGTLTENKALLITKTDATGSAGLTGEIQVFVIALPVETA